MNPITQNLYKYSSDTFFGSALSMASSRECQNIDVMNIKGTLFSKIPFKIIAGVLPNIKITTNVEKPADYYAIWGMNNHAQNTESLALAIRYKKPILLFEDGFLRSADTNANKKIEAEWKNGCSIVVDAHSYYFDATRPTTIENMLNDKNLILTDEQIQYAKSLMTFIVENKLTKYNHQPIVQCKPSNEKPKVLVLDQSFGDFAIKLGGGSQNRFDEMLQTAIHDNPDAEILVKVHPDTLTGTKKGYYDKLTTTSQVKKVSMGVNPYSILENVDKVYVCSSQFGFEALLAGKEVHVFGIPFYAGWGVTVDYQNCPRRTNKRTLEEIFYIFYCMYTRWFNPKNGKMCNIEQAMKYLIDIRTKYHKAFPNSQKTKSILI